MVSIPTGSITVSSTARLYKSNRCFNSNWFDYSSVITSTPPSDANVSIPTGSITVITCCRPSFNGYEFQFQLVRLQYVVTLNVNGRQTRVSIPTGSITVRKRRRLRRPGDWFQFQLVRLQFFLVSFSPFSSGVSIPTGSITVLYLQDGGIKVGRFQFQLVRLQLREHEQEQRSWRSFNSNWFDYSHLSSLFFTVSSVGFNSNWFDYSPLRNRRRQD